MIAAEEAKGSNAPRGDFVQAREEMVTLFTAAGAVEHLPAKFSGEEKVETSVNIVFLNAALSLASQRVKSSLSTRGRRRRFWCKTRIMRQVAS